LKNPFKGLTKAKVSAVYGVVIAILYTLINSNILGDGNTTTAQKILGLLVVFGSSVGIRSALPPKK